jgi:hypothetical protein
MQSVFTVQGEGEFPMPSFEIGVGFSGVPGQVVIELAKLTFSEPNGDPIPEGPKRREMRARMVMPASHARAIASAVLSAATQARA